MTAPRRYRLRNLSLLIRRILAVIDVIDRRHHAWYVASLDTLARHFKVSLPGGGTQGWISDSNALISQNIIS